jgi:hypothetical protein
MTIIKYLSICSLGVVCLLAPLQTGAQGIHAGPLFDEFDLTLTPGHRVEAAGPFYYSEWSETRHQWAIPPFFAQVTDPAVEYEEYDILYPLLTYDKFGKETRWQIGQLFSFAAGGTQSDDTNHRFTLFPLYFQQRSKEPEENYTAVIPFYGRLKHRLFRDEIYFVMMPFYVVTSKRGVITENMPYPFFHLRHGSGVNGWQLWPIVGHEHKDITSVTNGFGDVTQIPGHDRRFILWPFYSDSITDIGTEDIARQRAIIPFYVRYHSKNRDSTSVLWPFFTWTDDRGKGYREHDMPWPFVTIARGPGKTITRFWPIYSKASSTNLVSNTYMWPIYKYNRIMSEPLDRERTRILFFLYSDTREKNTETGASARRVAFLPFYTHRRDLNGNERLQILAILEPFFPTNKSIERDYTQLWALWRSEHNPKTKASSQSLLWNLYRRQASPEQKKFSLLFGLVQYQSTAAGKHWRICYIPIGGAKASSSEGTKGH